MTAQGDADSPWNDEHGEPPQPVADALERLTSARGWSQKLEGARVHEAWREIAGERLAQHIRPVRLHGGVLVVQATSSAWAAQVPYVAKELIARANAVLGAGQVLRLVVARGVRPS